MNPVQIKLSNEDQLKLIGEALNKRLETLRAQFKSVQKEMIDIEAVLAQIQKPQIDHLQPISALDSDIGKYSPSWSTSTKAAYMIKREGRPLTTAQIADFIMELESTANRPKLVRNLSVTFATQKKRFIRRINENGENEYSVAA